MALALLNISAACEGDCWPDSMYFTSLTEDLKRAHVVRAACEWIPMQLVHVCGIAGTSVHEIIVELATAGNIIGRLAATRRGDAPPPSAKEALGIFANYSSGDVSAMLRVERQRAMDAIEAAENQQAQKIQQPPPAKYKTYAGTGPFAPIVMDAVEFPPKQQSRGEPAPSIRNDEASILLVLRMYRGVTMTIEAIEDVLKKLTSKRALEHIHPTLHAILRDVSERSIKAKLPALINHRYVDRPKGAKGGCTIASLGERAISHLPNLPDLGEALGWLPPKSPKAK